MIAGTVPARSAYLRPRTLQEWTPATCRVWGERAREAGVDAVMTKLSALTDAQIATFREIGLGLVGSFTCYAPAGAAAPEVGRTPIDDSGRPVGQVEWYRGLVPGDATVEEARAAEFDRLLERGLTTTLVLDFLRWPGHWETEDGGARTPPATSFDPATLSRFVAWARENDVDAGGVDPHDPSRSATRLLGDLKPHWVEFRSELVTGFARHLARVAHLRSVAVGAFLVPVPGLRRREVYGQDIGALARVLDLFVPMTYHAIADRPARWSRDFCHEVAASVRKPVIAMVQLTSSQDYSGGWDWGPPVDSREVKDLLADLERDVARDELAGYCVFPGEALARRDRTVPHTTAASLKGPHGDH